MSRIEDSSILRHVRGSLGKMLVVRHIRGKAFLCLHPTFKKGKASKRQMEVRDRFKEATGYARKITTVPEFKKAYSAGIGDKFSTAYAVALADFLTRPKIHSVNIDRYHGKIGDKILIEATDDFHVASVFVAIVGGEGQLVESGNAIQHALNRQEWVYVSVVGQIISEGTKISVVAKDLPGNTVEVTVDNSGSYLEMNGQ